MTSQRCFQVRLQELNAEVHDVWMVKLRCRARILQCKGVMFLFPFKYMGSKL